MTPRMEPITDPSAWTPEELLRDPTWKYQITPEHLSDLDNALNGVNERGLTFSEIQQKDFPLRSLTGMLHDLLDQLRTGRGFAVLQGFPTDYGYDDLDKLYWGFGTHLGTGVTQNVEAGLIHYVTDGQLKPQGGARLLGKPRQVKLHVDLADCAGLFCVRQAPDDPQSLASSSMTVYNEILKHHPEYLPRLYEGFPWKRIASPFDETPYSDFNVPAYSETQGVVTCRFHPGWIRGGLKEAGKELNEEETEIFDFIAETAAANAYAFPLGTGDIAFFNNYTVFHGRDGHDEIEDENQKRVLLRLWLDLPDVRPFADEGTVRYGAVRHGHMGWTAADLLAGNHNSPHRRREDGVPEVL